MNRTTTITALAFIASLIATPVLAHGGPGGPGHMFKKMDTNQDGKISQSEALKVSDDHFAKVDKNGDKVITQEEAKAFGETMRAEHHSPEARAERFAKMDKNGDGKLQRDEIKMPEKHFTSIDTNKDNVLTKAELEAAHAKRQAAHANKSDKTDKADKKGNRGAHHFAKMDKDGDGKLSQAESRGAATARFAQMDKNGDQVVTKEEAQEAMKEFRKGHQGKRQAKTTK